MYRLALVIKSSLDLGAGDRPCLTCANISAEPAGRRGYVCTRFVDPISGTEIGCYAARSNADVCGAYGEGWEPVSGSAGLSETKADSLFANDLREGGGSCVDCRHCVSDSRYLRDIARCARLVTPLTGEPEACNVARHDTSKCGFSGSWFEPKLEVEESVDGGMIPTEGQTPELGEW